MRIRTKLLVSSLAAVVVLAAAVGAASATRLSLSNRNIRVVWTPLTFKSGSLAEIRCNVTLEGTFHSNTIVKREGALLGYITRGALTRPCVGGTAWIQNGIERIESLGGATTPNSLPWHITYQGFEGRLPDITALKLLLVGAAFKLRVTVIGITVLCLYKSTIAQPARGIARVAAGTITSLDADESQQIPFFEGSGLCPAEGEFVGSGRVTLLGNTTPITIRLI